MPLPTNLGDGRQAILDVINRLDKTHLTLNDVVFNVPEKNLDPNPLRNTRLSIVMKNSSSFYGSKIINYNRAYIDTYAPFSVDVTTELTYHDLIPKLNQLFDLHLTPYDVVDGPLPGSGLAVQITVPVKDSSYIYYTGQEILTTGVVPPYPTVAGANIELSRVCVGTDLFGVYTNGQGGTYRKLIRGNSVDCGGNGGPPPSTTAPPITTQPPLPNGVTYFGAAVTNNGQYVIY